MAKEIEVKPNKDSKILSIVSIILSSVPILTSLILFVLTFALRKEILLNTGGIYRILLMLLFGSYIFIFGSIITAIISLVKSLKHPQKQGKKLAVIALILSILAIMVVLGCIIYLFSGFAGD